MAGDCEALSISIRKSLTEMQSKYNVQNTKSGGFDRRTAMRREEKNKNKEPIHLNVNRLLSDSYSCHWYYFRFYLPMKGSGGPGTRA